MIQCEESLFVIGPKQQKRSCEVKKTVHNQGDGSTPRNDVTQKVCWAWKGWKKGPYTGPLCLTKSLLLRLKSGPFGNVLFVIYSLCMYIYIMFLLVASFVDFLCIVLRLFKCTSWIIHVLLLFCFFAGWSGWDNHRNGQDRPLFGEDAASISSSINEK